MPQQIPTLIFGISSIYFLMLYLNISSFKRQNLYTLYCQQNITNASKINESELKIPAREACSESAFDEKAILEANSDVSLLIS